VDDRRILNGIFCVLRSSAPWRDPPKRYGRAISIPRRIWSNVSSTRSSNVGASQPATTNLLSTTSPSLNSCPFGFDRAFMSPRLLVSCLFWSEDLEIAFDAVPEARLIGVNQPPRRGHMRLFRRRFSRVSAVQGRSVLLTYCTYCPKKNICKRD